LNSDSKNNTKIRKRIVYLLLIIFFVQIVIVARYAYVQIVWSPQLQKWASDQWTNEIKIDAKRGMILDRNMKPLAVSGNVERVDAYMKEINDAVKDKKTTKDEIAGKLSSVLNIDKATLLARLNKTLPNGKPMLSVNLARQIDKEQGNKIREMKLPGIAVYPDTKRYYPNGNLCSQVIGNVGIDGDGRAGIEYQYNNELKGAPGRITAETDKFMREMPYSISKYEPPKNGSDVVLTIDQSIQYFTEKVIEKGLKEYKAKQISAIVMDVKTGEILAMANKPDYDPNEPVKGDVTSSMALWKNRAVNDSFELGSVMKVVTASAALQEGLTKKSDTFVCNGSKNVAGHTIRCWKSGGHGVQTLPQILQNSCNVGFMTLGERLQKEKLHKYYDLYGFGKPTGIDYPGEQSGIIKPLKEVGPVELANESFGQGISVTLIQYITALSAIANDGKLMQPHLAKQIVYTDENDKVTETKDIKPKFVRQVISKENSELMREMLEDVVTKGAGKKAYIEGYHIGGKTGTAEKAINGKYDTTGKYISTFACIAPCNDPKIAVVLSIDEPDPSNYYSGSNAAPLTKILLEDIFRYLNMEPDLGENKEVVKEVTIPEMRGKSIADAEKILSNLNLNFEITGSGSIINDVNPKPGVAVKENTKINLIADNSQKINSDVAVPDFNEKTQKEILDEANALGIKVVFSGDGIGVSQDIQPKTIVSKGTTVKVILEKPEN
jgi:stage V sporulation protein D (sporulation-specific penicillin-binding protein)